MKQISKPDFFKTVGVLDVTPRVDVSTLQQRFHVSQWELRDRTTVGKTVQDSWGVEATEFWTASA